MRLIEDWKRVATRAYSMWAFYLSAVALIAPDAIYLLAGRDSNPRLWWFIALALLIYGIVGRLIDQRDGGVLGNLGRLLLFLVGVLRLIWFALTDRLKMRSSSAATFLAIAVAFVGLKEGKENHAYLDRIAKPPVWTICYGETRGVKPGDYRTDAECADMLAKGLLEYRAGLHRYFTPETIQRRLTPERDTAYVSLAWNVGIAGTGKSTATRRLNAGDIAGGCTAITWWNKAGGRVIRGLVLRRQDEYRLCMKGVR
ncbi:hypothetical protein GCM10011360_17390 [Primorskyibacter flagellatus]|uniref:Lysozyme n=1 Tax=Primorskyibacter flagellatus TaxID=1387277 RepID=A0A917A854_9RHOB|nr:lysozyme [Primorskyibacter flagellatus]GGE29858.1 hypothetical protein GCM10011360_17390 [Primorskyibacter flagellatus]